MKRLLFFAGCMLLLLSACKKDNKTTAATITVAIDGVEQSFNTRAMALLSSPQTLTLYGAKSLTDTTHVQIQLFLLNQSVSIGNYTARTYDVVTGLSTPGNFDGGVLMGYYVYPITVNSIDTNIYSVFKYSPATIVITELSNTNVQGTFNGHISNNVGAIKTINGSFNLPLLK